MEEKFKVEGMTCASCQAHVNQAVSKLKGVIDCNVSLVEKNMVVNFDENQLSEEQICQAVEKAGYKASIFIEKSYKEMMREKQAEITKRRNRLIVTLIFTAALMIFCMWHMFASDFNWWFFTMDPLIVIPVQIVLLVPILVLNFGYFTRGFKALITLKPNMDSLIAIGSFASVVYGLYSFIYIIYLTINGDPNGMIHSLSHNIYFESAGTIVGLVSLGKYFESRSVDKTMSSIYRLMELSPEEANVIENGKEVTKKIEKVAIGDKIIIRPGNRIPLDGIIESGYGEMDESSISGEAIPIYKKENDKVISGTICKQGTFVFKVTTIGKDTTLNKIITMVQEAANSKAKIAKLVDKVALIFVPVVILIALITFGVWMIISKADVNTSFNYAISVLVISCPCALGLATPVAIMVGTGKGAENGILIKSAEALENLASIDTVVFDKTGTITKGIMEVSDISLPQEELSNICSLENCSDHPLSKAVYNYASKNNIPFKDVSSFTYVPGEGIKGQIEDDAYLIGNKKMCLNYLTDDAEKAYQNLSNQGKTVMFVIKNGNYVGYIGISDSLKETSLQAVRDLKNLNRDVYMLTGDNINAAKYIASKSEIEHYIGDVKPDQKLDVIKKLQQEGKKVCMVGDGINDSPSLIQADVGMAIGAGSDVALDSADIVLIRSDLADVVSAIELSKHVVRTIKGNLFWAFFYNAIAIPLAAGCLSFAPLNITLNPMIASLAMALSSVTVVLNALRLNFFKRKNYNNDKETSKNVI